LLLELNRFTINSINHNHYDDNDRRALRDDGITANSNYWLRSTGTHTGHPIAYIWLDGYRVASFTNNNTIGIRPSFTYSLTTIYLNYDILKKRI